MMDDFADLEIRVFAPDAGAYRVELTLNGEQLLGQGSLDAESADAWAGDDGRQLFDMLLRDPALRHGWDMARAQAPRCRVRLCLAPEAAALHKLSWELLHDGHTALAADAMTPFSRYIAGEQRWGRAQQSTPLRVLAAISAPRDAADYGLPPLDYAAERAHLEDAFLPLGEERVSLTVLEPPLTAERIVAALPGQHVLHIIAHGVYKARREQSALYLQDAAGDVDFVSSARLMALFVQGARPQLVFMSACHSATGGAFRNLGSLLVSAGLPAVVAMRSQVSVKAARKLSMIFYRELAEHGVVDLALNRARNVLLAGQSSDVAAPLLLMRLKDGRLWENASSGSEPAVASVPPAQSISLTGSGAVNTGSGNALGAGAVQVHDVGGDLVTGSKFTAFDQRGQQVQSQTNIDARDSSE